LGQGLTDSEQTPLRPARLVALIASVLAGVAAALALMPALFRNTPTDVSRIGVLLDALHAPGAGLEIAVFGNSVIMSGIDAGQLSQELPGRPRAWNCASTGQSLVESFLLTQELPESVRVAIYQIERTPGGEHVALNPQKYNSFYLFGFRPSAETQAVLGRLYGDDVLALLTRPHWLQLFDARWAIRQLADTHLRVLLRRDLALASAERDLLHPQRYAHPIAPELLERFLRAQNDRFAEQPPRIADADRALATQIARDGASRGRRNAFLLAPVHPGLREANAEALAGAAAALEQALEGEALVLDATSLLDASHFIDDLHPTNEGARRLTRFVAERLAGAR
jgi:hypothetical protein